MKILALSDTHIGAGYAHRIDPLADADCMFAQVAALAEERGTSLVLHAGDVFHRAKPAPAELHVFKRFCEALAALEIPMVCLGGNGLHEAAPGQRSALELFESRWVRVSRRPECIPTLDGGAVCALPAATVGQLVARRNGGSREAAYAEAVELLVRVAADLFAEAPDDRPRILLAHQMVSGASLPAGLPVEQVGSLVLPLEALEAIGYDAIVLGDVHNAEKFNDWDAPVWYCGSPMCHDFGEADVPHGAWIWDSAIDEHGFGIAPEFVPLKDRRFVTVDVDLTIEGSVYLNETDHIAAFIAERFPLADTVVRVRVRAREDQWRRVDQPALERLIADAGAHRLYGGIQADLQREQQARAAGLSEALAPAAALALWCEAQEVPAEQAEALAGLLGEWVE